MSTGGHHLKLALGDTVKVRFKDHTKNAKNQNIGTIHFYGSVEGHKGTWFGLSFESSIGKNDGTYKKRKYFECEPKHGSFVQHQQIIKIINKAKHEHNIRIHFNSSIKIPGCGSGKVRFAGTVSFNPGIWYGIELDSPRAPSSPSGPTYSDSTVSGIEYFHCAPGYALFQLEQNLYALLSGKADIVTENNIKPSFVHSNSAHDKFNKKYNKHHSHKKIKAPAMKRSVTEPINSHSSSEENSVEIKDNQHHDHSNETKEDAQTDYDYELKLALNDRSDDMYGDDVDEKKKYKEKKHKLNIVNNAILIAESDTSDIDDNVASSEEEVKAPKMKKLIKSKSVPPKTRLKPRSESEPQPHSIYAKNLNVSAYLDHINDAASQRSPTSYNRPLPKSIKQLKNEFKRACSKFTPNKKKHTRKTGKTTGTEVNVTNNLKINLSTDKDEQLQLRWKQHSTPVRFGSLSLEYSEDESPPPVNDALAKPIPEFSKSMPFGPTKATTNPPEPIDISQSARNSLSNLERDRALTFPTMALNTDNATKISAATPHQQSFKVVLIGQSRVGKTSIIRRFVKNKFLSHYKMTLGAAQWHFKCEVPIDLIEEVQPDDNMLRSMTSFLDQVQEENENMIQQEEPMQAANALGAISNVDPFDEQDENCEFGAAYDYGSVEDDEYKLNNMDDALENIFDWRGNNRASLHQSQGSKSITDYGQFTVPEINAITKNTHKISMKLQISLDIVDMGFHPTEEELLDDVNAIILVVDLTKKGSISDAIDKYETFCKNSMYFSPKKVKKKGRRKKLKRQRSRSSSNPRGSTLPELEREYIPLIIAVNKCEIKPSKKQFKIRDIKRMIAKKLDPIIAEHFPEPKEEVMSLVSDAKLDDDDGDDDSEGSDGRKRRTRNFANTTLLAPPNLSFIYNNDGTGSDSEYESEEEEEDEEEDKTTNLLQVHTHHDQQISDPGDPFNTPRNPNAVKRRRKKSSKKKKKKERDKSNIRYIDIVQCSAKTGKNIEKLFGRCIKKTIPSKLTKSVSHKRTKTTAHVTAPIWLRQVVAEFEKEPANENHPFWETTPNVSDVDDNFTFLGDDYASD